MSLDLKLMILIVFMAVLRHNVFNANYINIPLSGLSESFWYVSLGLLINAIPVIIINLAS